MANLALYKSSLGLATNREIVDEFRNSLAKTNRSHTFYVDWDKVKKNIGKIAPELGLLDSLINSSDLKSDFVNLLSKYPEVVRVLPILLAIRDAQFDIIEDFNAETADVITYSFSLKRARPLTVGEIESYWQLIERSGAFVLFTSIRNFKDYIFGVEVGMDTNARKNRSGNAMELLLQPLMEVLSNELGLTLYAQRKFVAVEKETQLVFPGLLANKKFDFLLAKNDKALNIEVNYFSGAGSKTEIINSYIERQRILKNDGHQFALITDGTGWAGSNNNELASGIENLDNVLNLAFLRRGFLKTVLQDYFA